MSAIDPGPWQPPQKEREQMRLDLVGLAAEIATVASLVSEDLPAESQDPRVDELRSTCIEHFHRALAVLSRHARLEDFTESSLLQAWDSLRDHQMRVRRLRSQAECLRDGMPTSGALL